MTYQAAIREAALAPVEQRITIHKLAVLKFKVGRRAYM